MSRPPRFYQHLCYNKPEATRDGMLRMAESELEKVVSPDEGQDNPWASI